MNEEAKIKQISKDGINIHIFESQLDGEMVNSIIVESQNKLVIIDVPLLRHYSKGFRNYAERLGKPIDRVIITHGHPDHWAGLEDFKDLQICSLIETQSDIRDNGDWMLGYHRQLHGNMIADEKVVPNMIIDEGQIAIDGVLYNIMKVKETEYRIMLVIDIPQIRTLIAQDMVYNKVFLFLGEKTSTGDICCDNWIRELEKYKNNNYETVIPGHGEPADAGLLQLNIDYLKDAKNIIKTSKSGEEFKERLTKNYPDFNVPLLIDMSSYFLFPQDNH